MVKEIYYIHSLFDNSHNIGQSDTHQHQDIRYQSDMPLLAPSASQDGKISNVPKGIDYLSKEESVDYHSDQVISGLMIILWIKVQRSQTYSIQRSLEVSETACLSHSSGLKTFWTLYSINIRKVPGFVDWQIICRLKAI